MGLQGAAVEDTIVAVRSSSSNVRDVVDDADEFGLLLEVNRGNAAALLAGDGGECASSVSHGLSPRNGITNQKCLEKANDDHFGSRRATTLLFRGKRK